MLRATLVVIVLALLLGACSSPAASPAMIVVTATPEPVISAPTQALAPTDAPAPTQPPAPTPTPEPTATPEPSATPAPTFERWASADAIAAFQAAGLEAEGTRPMTKDDYGMAPFVATEGTRFYIPSLGPDNGGRVMSFTSPDDLALVKGYYVELGRASAAFFSWTFARDNILVQINGDLPETQARQYEAALMAME